MSKYSDNQYVRTLKRRKQHLEKRIQINSFPSTHLGQKEVDALDFSLGCALIVLKAGLLDKDAFNPELDE